MEGWQKLEASEGLLKDNEQLLTLLSYDLDPDIVGGKLREGITT